jgi:hypothetical protein
MTDLLPYGPETTFCKLRFQRSCDLDDKQRSRPHGMRREREPRQMDGNPTNQKLCVWAPARQLHRAAGSRGGFLGHETLKLLRDACNYGIGIASMEREFSSRQIVPPEPHSAGPDFCKAWSYKPAGSKSSW